MEVGSAAAGYKGRLRAEWFAGLLITVASHLARGRPCHLSVFVGVPQKEHILDGFSKILFDGSFFKTCATSN